MELKLACNPRTEKKKNANGRLRRAGSIPANLIQDGVSTPITIPEADFMKLLGSGLRQSSLINLDMKGGDSSRVIVKEIQRHPVSGKILHLDFFGAKPKKKLSVKIGIELDGTPIGVKKGGALEHYIRSIKLKATPESLIDVIRVDVSGMDVGQSVHLRDLPIHSDWDIKVTGNPIVAKIAKSRLVAAEEPAKGS
jgi:large subunit ribosomal protein L25